MHPLRPALLALLFLGLGSLVPLHQAQARPNASPAAPSYTYRDAFAALDEGRVDYARAVMARGSDPVLNKVLLGYLMARPGNDYSFDELAGFVSDNPDWPGLKGILMIAEQKIPAGASASQLVNWFNAHAPLTASGFLRYVEALDSLGQGQNAVRLVKSRWIEKDFGGDDIIAFRSRYAPLLTEREHIARLDRLLWDGNVAAARAMYPYVSGAYQALAEARLALAGQTGNVEGLINRVPESLQRDSGLLYERLRWRRKNSDDDGAIDILVNPPETIGHADKWWEESNILIRRLMEKKDFKLAYRIASHHRLTTGFDFVQAEFMAGWLALRFMNRLDLAHQHFTNLLNDANSPISKARGYYWIGRTYEAAGQKDDAEQAYQTAAALNTTYYGQLAITRLYQQPSIRAATEPAIPQNIRSKFFSRDAVQAVSHLYRAGQNDRARAFFKAIGDEATKRVDFALLLELAYQLQRPDWAVSAAKAANQKNFILTGAAYPVLSMNIPSPPERALTHALIRQESQFKADAGSPVGARGLMQLMPGTAKDCAKKLGMSYSPDRIVDPDYNVRLGTYFIQTQIDNFDGSYILALAGYNAGPRRAREWMDTFGDPRTDKVDAIDWIELIPIYETRNYVQRIIENLQFYRARLNNGQAPLSILQDLKR